MLLLPRVHLLTFFAQVWADGFGIGALAHFGAVALPNTNFWDPVGSPAPTSTLLARVPEVELTWMARQCAPGLYSATQNVVINSTLNILFDVFLGACLGVVYMWYITSSMRSRMMHMVYGNMGQGRKGKGKGAGMGDAKGKSKAGSDVRSDAVAPLASVFAPSASNVHDVSADVRSVIPQAAILRAQSQLVQDDWSVPVFSHQTHQTLSSRGGVSAVPVDHIAEVVQRVGFTSSPVAILITRDPDRCRSSRLSSPEGSLWTQCHGQ